jgi:translation initiation factor 1 (eIF-1/SUI1)
VAKREKAGKPDLSGANAPLAHNPFAALGGGKVAAPTSEPERAERAEMPGQPERAEKPPKPAKAGTSGRWVVRQERKGHGGKTVTIAKGPAPPEGWEALAKVVGKALGCRASAGAGELVVSGDQRERLAAWLREHGARDVVLGN